MNLWPSSTFFPKISSLRLPRVAMEDGNTAAQCKLSLATLPHLRDYIPNLPTYVNPLSQNAFFHPISGFFVGETHAVIQNLMVDVSKPVAHAQSCFLVAGPREHVIFNSEEVRAVIVTCGGLCPGLNTVIRELVNGLWYQYGVREIKGIQAGYRGFYSWDHIELDPKVVDHWHKQGGTRLGTSRGGFNLKKIVDAIEDHEYNMVFIIGGDGTLRGAVDIFEEIKQRKLKIAIACLPKTVDNDVGIIDRSFGFHTAVEVAQAAINAAHVEAESTPNGVGLVKIMGRYAGHIAVNATLGSRDVDCCLIPEVPFYLQGEGGLFEFMDQRLLENGHCVILVAEGAGQELIECEEQLRDESGNVQLGDIGHFIKKEYNKWWTAKHPDKLFAVKYIDPTYMVRAVPSNATDTLYCTLLAHSAIHGAMAGYTGFVAGPVNGVYSLIPLDQVAHTKHLVDVSNPNWAWVRSVNNQPDFIKPNENVTQKSVRDT